MPSMDVTLLARDLASRRSRSDCRPFCHFAICFSSQSYPVGENDYREVYPGCCYYEHAEVSAIKKLPPNCCKKRKIKIDILVIRVTKTGALCNSKPCFKCLEHMSKLRYYVVKNVYYSTSDGQIVMESFSKLYNEENKHISIRFRTDYHLYMKNMKKMKKLKCNYNP
jgi:hypothetical protein